MVDPDDTRREPKGVFEALGPTSGNPPEIKRRNRWIAGITIVVASIVFIIAGLVMAPYFGVLNTEDSELPPPAKEAPFGIGEATNSPAAAIPEAKPGDCRPFEQVVDMGGVQQTLTGQACMQPDGSWKIVEQN